jgi:glycosyltransferase involved in cell wall biosynthesis
MQKVLFIITKSNWGGAQSYVFDLATSLPHEQFEVTVAFGGMGVVGEEAGRLASMLSAENIRTIFVPELGRNISFKHDWRAFGALRKLIKDKQPDIVHLNSSKVGGMGALAARLEGVKKVIFTAHGWPFWEKRSAIARSVIFLISYLTILLSHKTICISEFDREHIRLMPFTRKKTIVIHNGISQINFLSRTDARDALFSQDVQDSHQHDVWVVTNAELHPNKNLFAGIDAVDHHNKRRPQKVFYAIMSDGELRIKIEKYISEKKLSSQIVLLGFVPDGRRYMSAFDVFLLPSKKEGLPYVILEAGGAGLAVIASNIGGIPEIIDNQKSGLLISLQEKDGFARALDTLVVQKDLREKLGINLKQKVQKEFSLTRMIERTEEIYLS